MPSIEDLIKDEEKHGELISLRDMNEVSQRIRRIAADYGLGVAMLVAWQHGLKIGHIPLERDEDGREKETQADVIPASGDCPYMFVHVPIRMIRGDPDKLAKRRIMSQDADPAGFIYHEDGLIGTFSFQDPESVGLTGEDIREILDTLEQQGVIMTADINSRQIQFKDLVAKRRIENSREKVYVRVGNLPLEGKARLPAELNWEEVWGYLVKTLGKRSACNYCSVQALTPYQVTIHSAHISSAAPRKHDLATVRNYQLGFTFAPFGHPRKVCHFLAWDFPHVNDLVMNMEPQAYSFSDLIKLVRAINQDISDFYADEADPHPEPVSGICNHWAGNSIYHQHYQFVRITLPLMQAFSTARPIAGYKKIEVRKFSQWQAPAYLITSSEPDRDQDVMHVADRVAREWHILSEEEEYPYGNGIAIRNHTQNIFVTIHEGLISAIFIPRDRRKIDTSRQDNMIQKKNAGVLEMMGYFLIDDPDDFAKVKAASTGKQRELGDSWLSELAPTREAIQDFETNLRVCLTEAVTSCEERIDEIIGHPPEELRQEAWMLASGIQRDKGLVDEQRAHLYRELLSGVLDSSTGDLSPQPIE